jgi:hypothetical protein
MRLVLLLLLAFLLLGLLQLLLRLLLLLLRISWRRFNCLCSSSDLEDILASQAGGSSTAAALGCCEPLLLRGGSKIAQDLLTLPTNV